MARAGTTTTTDDAYENNDTFATANNLGTITAARTISSLVMADSADWFRFTTSATGTSTSNVSISFLNSQGNLQLALYNSSGSQVALVAQEPATANRYRSTASPRALTTSTSSAPPARQTRTIRSRSRRRRPQPRRQPPAASRSHST